MPRLTVLSSSLQWPSSLFWFGHALCLVVASAWLAWLLLVPADFGFTAGYRLLGIDDHIRRYGPQNVYLKGYESTSFAERQEHFRAIVRAIHHDGEGLTKITYQGQLKARQPLLRQPEIIHLQDVARLVGHFRVAGIVALLVWIGGTLWLLQRARQGRPFSAPDRRRRVMAVAVAMGLTALPLVLAGPTQVFYWLHEQVFPAGHQWFFYYQESLMTTLMKAPDLFGFIGAVWALLVVLIAWITGELTRRLLMAMGAGR